MIQELKTWLFQCDGCGYADTVKAVKQPELPQECWGLTKITTSSGSCQTTQFYHWCSGCFKNGHVYTKKCARTACEAHGNGCIHRDTGKNYCARCARNINEMNGEIVVRFPDKAEARKA